MKSSKTLQVHMDWGPDGLSASLEQGDVVVIVDILRFSSTVTTAVAHGYSIFPAPRKEDVPHLAQELRAIPAGFNNTFSLSPSSFSGKSLASSHSGRVVLYSQNGAVCSSLVKPGDIAFIGSFLNASACARKAEEAALRMKKNITIIPAGEERAQIKDGRVTRIAGSHREFALEDFLGSGAIIAGLGLPKTPEALVAESAYLANGQRLPELLRNCISGLELTQKNKGQDIEHVLPVNCYLPVPIIEIGWITAAE